MTPSGSSSRLYDASFQNSGETVSANEAAQPALPGLAGQRAGRQVDVHEQHRPGGAP